LYLPGPYAAPQTGQTPLLIPPTKLSLSNPGVIPPAFLPPANTQLVPPPALDLTFNPSATGVFPKTPAEMDELLGLAGELVPDLVNTPGRNKVVWYPSGNIKITYEQHPYHPNAPESHKGPHWHVEGPAEKHGRYLSGDAFP
jgi:hypothetical protein